MNTQNTIKHNSRRQAYAGMLHVAYIDKTAENQKSKKDSGNEVEGLCPPPEH